MATFKETLTKIWKFLNSPFFAISVIILLIIFGAITCNRIMNLKQDISKTDQNMHAMTDSLKTERKRNGEIIVSIAGYIATEKELKTLNRKLWDKIQEQDGRILSLNHSIVLLQQDSATLRKHLVEKDKQIAKLLKIDENTYVAPWSLTYKYDSTNYDIFEGKTYIGVLRKDTLELAHIDTELTKRLTQIDLTWGQKVEDKMLRVFIQSNYPGFSVKQMEGVLIDPNSNPWVKTLTKKKHWFNGWSIGVGTTSGWDITSGKFGWVVGPSFQYSIYSW